MIFWVGLWCCKGDTATWPVSRTSSQEATVHWIPCSLSWIAVVVSISIGCAGGCGYSQRDIFPADVQTISVPVFENLSFYQGLEFNLTEAIIKEIELRTPYKVTSARDADTILQGTIVEVRQNRLSRTVTGDLPQELEVRLVVDFEWRASLSGQALRQRRGLTAVERYVPAGSVGEVLSVGQHQAMGRMARQIVDAMGSPW